jgi:hypothetical protein
MPSKPAPDGAKILAAVLRASKPRPARSDKADVKNKYASRFADRMAKRIASDLKPRLKGISASTKRTARSVGGSKQLDVNFSTPSVGLAVGISLKSVHIRDVKSPHRYTHNMKRNEEELRIEATGYHKRQPYAVMAGVLFLPIDSCDDGKTGSSSFGSFVRHLRPYAGRKEPDDENDKFEKIYVALYDPAGTALGFFDVEWDPPKKGRPARLLSYAEFLEVVYAAYLERNKADFTWAEGEKEPLEIDEEPEKEGSDEA